MTCFDQFMAIIRLIVLSFHYVTSSSMLHSGNNQPDDGHELAETCRWLISRIYILLIYLVVLLTTFNIYKFHTHKRDDIP